MSKYKDWITTQDSEFIKEVHGDNEIPNVFKDYFNKIDCSLDDLEQLDNKYILQREEGNNGK